MSNVNEDIVDVDALADFSPEMIAHKIFTKDANPPCSYQILAYQKDSRIAIS